MAAIRRIARAVVRFFAYAHEMIWLKLDCDACGHDDHPGEWCPQSYCICGGAL
jgi:hypothetical protein